MADSENVGAMSFEDAQAELEKIVAQLERGDVALADSVRIYRRGAALRAHAEQLLSAAQLQVEQVVVGADGVRVEPARLGA